MADKNYYMEQGIGDSGVGSTRNPIYLNELETADINPFESYTPRRVNVGDVVTNESGQDSYLGSLDEVYSGETTVEDLRANQQSNWQRMGNALANNIVIAGTTAVSGTLGLANGIVSAIYNGNVDKMWNNAVNNWAVNVQEATREALPIHRGREYEEKNIFQKMGSGIFWADLVQNLGFAEGMMITGGGMSKLLSAAPAMLRGTISTLYSAMGEAAIEATHSKNDEEQSKLAIANQRYNELAEGRSNFELGILYKDFQDTKQQIEEDAVNAGNFVYGSNIALLTISNGIQFGKLFSRGFGTTQRLSGALKRKGKEYMADNMGLSIAGTIGKKVLDATSEGIEEVSQGIITKTPSNYDDYNTFNESMFNPEKRELVSSVWQALGQGFSEAMHDSNTAVEFATGFLTGAIGIPRLRKSAMPIKLEGNIVSEVFDTYNQVSEARTLADKINTRLGENKKINEYYNGLVRHLALQEDINNASDGGDAFNYKNAESAQLISDIMMFDNAGDIKYFKSIISDSIDMSDETIQSIIDETSKDGEGPFMSNGNPMSVEEVREILEEKKQTLLGKIDSYQKDKEKLQRTHPNMDEATLSNVIFLKEQFKDKYSRYNILQGELVNELNILFDNRTSKNKELPIVTRENLPQLLADKSFISDLNELLNSPSATLVSAEEKQALADKINDTNKLEESLIKINKNLVDIINKPEKSAKALSGLKEKIINKVEESHIKSIKDGLKTSTNISEFRDLFSVSDNSDEIKEKALESLIAEGNPIAKTFKELRDYDNEVTDSLFSEEDYDTARDARELFRTMYNKSQNLAELSSTDSGYIDDTYIFDEDISEEENKERYIKAHELLANTLNKVNEARNKKGGFAEPVASAEEGEVKYETPKKEDTGDSETTKIPTVTITKTEEINTTPINVEVTAAEVIEENKEVNQSIEDKTEEVHQYYAPVIPEIHVDGARVGDFRPFNEYTKDKGLGNFDIIYNYLKDKGAFTYVNEGNLKSGDEIIFVIDPQFEESVQNESWYDVNNPTIFMAHRKSDGSYQIVGSLGSTENYVNNYEGLGSLRSKIVEEYKEKGSTDTFIATPTTKVNKIMVGKVPVGNEEKSLREINNVKEADGKGRKPILGIVKNGRIVTNNAISDSEITNPMVLTGEHEGRVYLLIPNGDNKYSPRAVRVKHFNSKEMPLGTPQIDNLSIVKRINEVIDKMAKSENEEDFNNAFSELQNLLYIDTDSNTRTTHIDFITTNEGGKVIKISKVKKDNDGNDIYTTNSDGKRVREEDTTWINVEDKDGNRRSLEEIKKELVKAIQELNFSIQVDAGRINSDNYNDFLIDSDVLTSNITNAKVVSNWFVTDYIIEGETKKATAPKSKEVAPVVSNSSTQVKETVITGYSVSVGDNSFIVDLETDTIYNTDGEVVTPANAELLKDLAWADKVHGTKTIGANLWNNKTKTPSGKILDRTSKKYLEGKEEQEANVQLSGNAVIINKIEENQKNVDKENTDGDFYYIKEEDGQYHAYDRVHSRLGENWITDSTTQDLLDIIKTDLDDKIKEGKDSYDKYLAELEKRHEVNLTEYKGNPIRKNISGILTTIKDKKLGIAGKRALNAGTAVDTVIREFFTQGYARKPENLSSEAFISLTKTLRSIKTNITAKGEIFLTNNIVLYHRFPDGSRVAGEVDILALDAEGHIKIYDVKTSKNSFSKYFDSSKYTVMSNREYYTLQLSAYKTLFEEQYGKPVSSLAILPFVLSYEGNTVKSIDKEADIPITYNPEIRKKLDSQTSSKEVKTVSQSVASTTNNEIPIFNKNNTNLDSVDRATEGNKFDDSSIGYYISDGILFKGYIAPMNTIDSVPVYYTRVYKGSESSIGYDYYVVFPNGNSVKVIQNAPISESLESIKSKITQALSGNLPRLHEMNSAVTIFSKEEVKVETPKEVTPTISASNKAQQSVNKTESEFEEPLQLREAKDNNITVWDRKKETEWLSKVLPQLSTEDRLKVVKGLIRVGNHGLLAWGRFSKGIITLSDIAAEGTLYHEAFHAVFNLMLDNSERVALLAEARQMYGNKSDLALEEDLAEGFREYVMSRDTNNLLDKIKNFFKDLWIKVSNWKKVQPHLDAYYKRINEGYYGNKELGNFEGTRNMQEQYTEEMQSIKDKAIADGTFMKAPNGQPTNLNERQWLQVRTKAFKEWFGDWEKSAEANKVSLGRIIPNDNKYAQYGQKGETDVEIREVLDENGKIIGTVRMEFSGKNRSGVVTLHPQLSVTQKGYGTALYQHIANTYNIPVEESFGEIGKSEAGKALWNKLQKQNNVQTSKEDIPLRQLLPANASKVVDENGEPKPVFHYTDNENLTIFSTEFNNYFAQSGGTKKAIFFTDDNVEPGTEDNFLTSRKKKLEVFLNIRDLEKHHGTKEDLHKKGTTYREVVNNSANKNKIDNGLIFTGFDDNKKENQTIYVVHNPNQIKSATDNIGTFSRDNDDIRYSMLTSQEIAETMDKEYATAKRIVQELNSKRYTTEIDALNAFYNSGIPRDLFYRITRAGSNNAVGYKIQLLTKEAYNTYKESVIDSYVAYDEYINTKKQENTLFDSLDPEIQTVLLNKGWTKEVFDRISQEEKDIAIHCAYI